MPTATQFATAHPMLAALAMWLGILLVVIVSAGGLYALIMYKVVKPLPDAPLSDDDN